MRLRSFVVATLICIGLAALGSAAAIAVRLTDFQSPQPVAVPQIADVPALPPASGTSTVVVPAVIALTAVRDALESQVPPTLTGARDIPASRLVSNGQLNWNVVRGPLAVYGKPELLAATVALKGTLRATGRLSERAAGRLGKAVSGLLGEDAARTVQKLAARPLDQRAEIHGTIAVIARPAITQAWRIEPNFTPQLSIGDVSLMISGTRVNVGQELKPLLEEQLKEEIARFEEALRNSPFLEQAVRREWSRLCRSVPVGAAGAGLPNLWLEVRPTRAIAAQPQIDGETVTLVVGLEAQTRVMPGESKPDCPFPATLTVVPQAEAGHISIVMPIDAPFTEVNRLIEAQLVGKTFPEDKNGPLEATVRAASVTPSGDRLLLTLRVLAKERTSWLGMATEGAVHIWSRPVLDASAQVIRLTDLSLAVESQGALGAALRAAVPLLERALAERAVIDLKPYAAHARKSIETALAEFRAAGDGVRVDAAVTELRIGAIAFDRSTLRIVTEVKGAAKIAVAKLPR
jgi:hypothetical protein